MSKKILKTLKIIWALIPVAQRNWVLDKMLDYAENQIEESENKIDDELLPLIQFFRDSFGIEDND